MVSQATQDEWDDMQRKRLADPALVAMWGTYIFGGASRVKPEELTAIERQREEYSDWLEDKHERGEL